MWETKPTPTSPKLSAPARRALARAGYERLEQLNGVEDADLSRLHGMGPSAIKTLREALTERGLSLRDRYDDPR
jgi:hypothetical protein